MTSQQSPAPTATGDNGWLWCTLAAVLFAVSALCMVLAARGDLFIDEVLSLFTAQYDKSWTDVFTWSPTDNNHLLNTLILHALGNQQHLFIYRIPALIFGIALLGLLMAVSRRFGKTLPVWVAALAGLSYPIILPSSEARGYSAAMFFAVLAFEFLQRCWERCTPLRLILFWVFIAMGTLSHFSFVMVCMALGIWSLSRDGFAGGTVRTIAVNAIKYYAVPAAFLVWLYFFYIRSMAVLGGANPTRWEAISDAALYVLGFAPLNGLRVLAVLVMVALVFCGIWKLFRQKRDVWVFFASVIFIAPALVIVLWQPRYLYFRYFTICFPFFYLLLAYVFAGWFEKPGKVKFLPLVFVASITAGHAVKIANLFHYGRGHYRQALEDMAAATQGSVIRISSNQDFKNGTLVDFYALFLPSSKHVDYIPRSRRDQETPEWFIICCDDPAFPAYPGVEVGRIGKYDLFGSYSYCGSSGWCWFVYHRSPEKLSAK